MERERDHGQKEIGFLFCLTESPSTVSHTSFLSHPSNPTSQAKNRSRTKKREEKPGIYSPTGSSLTASSSSAAARTSFLVRFLAGVASSSSSSSAAAAVAFLVRFLLAGVALPLALGVAAAMVVPATASADISIPLPCQNATLSKCAREKTAKKASW